MSPAAGTYLDIRHPTVDHKPFKGYLVRPAQSPARAVLLLHEAYGLNDNMRDLAHRFAEAGYVALVADLFSDGNKIICIFRAFYGVLLSPLKNKTADNVVAAFQFLRGVEGVDARRVGAIGFCLGGSYALQLACLDDTVSAVSVVSAQNPRPAEAFKRACPIVGSYAERDFTTGGARQLDTLLHEYKVSHEIKIYPGGIHSLLNDSARNYDPVIAADAWQRTLDFFSVHIGS